MAGTQRLFASVLCALLLAAAVASAQTSSEQDARLLLSSGLRAYKERNYPLAGDCFREFLNRFGNHRDASAAHYGLALCLLNGPQKDYNAAVKQLVPLAGNKQFAERPFVFYYLGLARRGQGLSELAQAEARPQDAKALRAAAQQRFEEAVKHFAEALTAFAERRPAAATGKQLPVEAEWTARTRCDLAEVQLRALKPREAQATTKGFLNDAVLVKSRSHSLGLYYHGFASFLLKDYVTAGRSLNQVTPFTDPVFGTHARYLLARVHHLTDERAEAAGHYEGLVADYAKLKQIAAEALRHPETFQNDPDAKEHLEALVREPAPDHVGRALFYLGMLHYEDGRFAEALTRFTDFARQFPKSSLLADVQLQQGLCQVQLKQFAEALRVLQPLADREARLADQALFWIAKAQIAAADPNNVPAYTQALRTATETLRRAADKSEHLSGTDPDVRRQRGEILLELGDTQQLARQHGEAAATYAHVLDAKLLPQREEELLQRWIDALHLAGDYAESDRICRRFQEAYPKSILLPAVLFRYAENAWFLAQAAEKDPKLPNRARELSRLRDEAANRYRVVVERFPEAPSVNLARYGLALVAFRKGEIEAARQVLETIPQADRTGELAIVSYVLADSLLRLAPTRADDALAAGKMEEELRGATELLDSFIAAQPTHERVPDALLKLGLCQQRLASLLAQPPEKAKALAAARAAYRRLLQQFPKHAVQPQAVFERAKCLAQAGDKQGAINELQRFAHDPLKGAPVAPMALLHLSVLLRGQKRAGDAAVVLAQCRQQHEQALGRDPERAGWVSLLQYHHGLALKEAGKLPEARGIFELIGKQAPNCPEAAEAALRWGQCRKEEGLAVLEAGRKKLASARKPEETRAAQRTVEDGLRIVQEAVTYLDGQAEQLKAKQPAGEVRARMLYEAAWGCRTLADAEVAARTPARPEVPLQPSEQKARAEYQALIADAGELSLATDARLELAELLADRGEHVAAIKLLGEALDKEPSAELAEKIRLRLGACHAARKDSAAALAQFQIVAQNPKSPLAGQAHYRAGECLLQTGKWAEAVKHLALFRDQAPYQNLAGLTDRALLRLGHALAQLNQWDASRQAHERVVGRFGNGPWAQEARYGVGWAWQHQRNYDQAINAYNQAVAAGATETAARAQLQIGLCRLEQKRFAEAATALLVVTLTYDHPELNAVALCEAARAYTELKQHEQAEKLLRRVLRDHPESKWAAVAKERLALLKRS